MNIIRFLTECASGNIGAEQVYNSYTISLIDSYWHIEDCHNEVFEDLDDAHEHIDKLIEFGDDGMTSHGGIWQ